MHNIYFNNRLKCTASRFDELSADQLLDIVDVMHSRLSFDQKVARYTMILMDFKRDWRSAWNWLFRLSADDKMDIARITEFIHEEPQLTKNLLPVLKIGHLWKKSQYLYGPGHKLKKMVFMEFIKCEVYFLKFHNLYKKEKQLTKDAVSALDMLVATLYRPARKNVDDEAFNGDLRRKYNDDQVEWIALHVKKLSLNVKLSILIFYTSCRLEMIKPYRHLYPEMPKPEDPKQNSETTDIKGTDWMEALNSIAGGSLSLHGDKAAMADARLALKDLDNIIKENKRREALKPK
ncbi:MAG: hypothetical protein JXR07_20485 [Reichenbachiella sp.]